MKACCTTASGLRHGSGMLRLGGEAFGVESFRVPELYL